MSSSGKRFSDKRKLYSLLIIVMTFLLWFFFLVAVSNVLAALDLNKQIEIL